MLPDDVAIVVHDSNAETRWESEETVLDEDGKLTCTAEVSADCTCCGQLRAFTSALLQRPVPVRP